MHFLNIFCTFTYINIMIYLVLINDKEHTYDGTVDIKIEVHLYKQNVYIV